MKDWIAPLMAYDWGADRGTLADIDQRIAQNLNDKKQLQELEIPLLEVLQSDATLPAKEYVCRQLALIGSDAAVPVLAKMLHDEHLADCARFALEAIPRPAAAKALRDALDTLEGTQRIGTVNALGERRDRKAAAAIAKLRKSADRQLAAAAESASRKIAAAKHRPGANP